MSTIMARPYHIDADKRQQFAGIVVLETLSDRDGTIALLLEGNDVHLEPILDWLHNRGHLEIVDDECYGLSTSGRQAVARYRAHYREFLRTFDIYSSVDLEEGSFAFERMFDFEHESDWQEYLGRDNWDDLRIPVAELKGLDALELVFLSFVNEGHFHDAENWQLELADDALWGELEDICNDSMSIDDLAFDDPEEGRVEGRDFLEDIVREGAELNLELKRQEQEIEAEQGEHGHSGEDSESHEEVEEIVVEEYYPSYYDPYYVSPVWMAVWWL